MAVEIRLLSPAKTTRNTRVWPKNRKNKNDRSHYVIYYFIVYQDKIKYYKIAEWMINSLLKSIDGGKISFRGPAIHVYASPDSSRCPPYLTSSVAEWCFWAFLFSWGSIVGHVRNLSICSTWGKIWVQIQKSNCHCIDPKCLRLFLKGPGARWKQKSYCFCVWIAQKSTHLKVHTLRILRYVRFRFPSESEFLPEFSLSFALLFSSTLNTFQFASGCWTHFDREHLPLQSRTPSSQSNEPSLS